MRADVRKAIWVNSIWTAVLVAVVGTLIGGSIYRLQTARGKVAEMSDTVRDQQHELELLPDVNEQQTQLSAARATTRVWTELVDNEADRISELSAAARNAGVTIVSFESSQPQKRESGHILISSFELVAVGSYNQLSHFLSGVYAARGMAAIERLSLVPDPGNTPNMLRAGLTVVWNAPGPGPDPLTDEEAAGS